MSVLQAVILGIVQGATEFIPVSSSGHLIVLPRLLGWGQDQGLAFDAALHVGTLLALLAYFRKDLTEIIRTGTSDLLHLKKRSGNPLSPRERAWVRAGGWRSNTLIAIIIASIPAAVAGVLLEKTAETAFRSAFLVAGTLSVVSVVMFAADRAGAKTRSMQDVRLLDWLVIGFAQAVALVPGVSRSGITISAGLVRGLERDAAARSSFLLSVPAIAGAAIFAVRDALSEGFPKGELLSFIVGIAAAAVVGYLCIGFLIGYLKRYSVNLFVFYRLALAAFIVFVMLYLRT